MSSPSAASCAPACQAPSSAWREVWAQGPRRAVEGFPEEAAWAARVPMTFSSSDSTPALGSHCSSGDSCQSGVARPVPGHPPEPRRGVADSEVWASEPESNGTGPAVLLDCFQCRSTAQCGDGESGGGETEQKQRRCPWRQNVTQRGQRLGERFKFGSHTGVRGAVGARAWGGGATGYKAQGEWDVGPQDRAHGRGLAPCRWTGAVLP